MEYAEILPAVLEGRWVRPHDNSTWVKMNDGGYFVDEDGSMIHVHKKTYAFNTWEVKSESLAEDAIIRFHPEAIQNSKYPFPLYKRESMIGMFNAGRELGLKESEFHLSKADTNTEGIEILIHSCAKNDLNHNSIVKGVVEDFDYIQKNMYKMFKLVLIDEQKQNEYRDVKIERWKPLRTKSTNPEYHPEMTPEEFVEAYSLENLDNKVDGYTYEDMVVVVRLAMSIT